MKKVASASPIIATRRELVLLVDFSHCNPQGDPDNENCPRTDPETGRGLITPQGPKRKIRDNLTLMGHTVYMARGSVLGRTNREVAATVGCEEAFDSSPEEGEEGADAEEAEEAKGARSKSKKSKVRLSHDKSHEVYAALCQKYIDFRLFGGMVPQLVGTGAGPVQFSMGESIDPVTPMPDAITRVAVATEKDEQRQGGANRGMGRQWRIPYGLYRFHIFVNPYGARRTGLTEVDYELFLQATATMFDNDKSSARATACVRALYEFRHAEHAAAGAVSGQRLVESIRVRKRVDGVARQFADYEVKPAIYMSEDFELREIVKPVEWKYDEALLGDRKNGARVEASAE